MRVRLIRKFATNLNGVDLSLVKVGDVIHLPEKTALMLLEEGWAERTGDRAGNDPQPKPQFLR